MRRGLRSYPSSEAHLDNLMRAVNKGDYELVASLLSQGVDPSEEIYRGQNALHLAALRGHDET